VLRQRPNLAPGGVLLMTIYDDNIWWKCLITISDDNFWWQFLMTIFNDNFWWTFFNFFDNFGQFWIFLIIFDNWDNWDNFWQFWKDSPWDLWHLRHWLQFWQLRTWIHDNIWYLTINCDTGQHSQFLWCLNNSMHCTFLINNVYLGPSSLGRACWSPIALTHQPHTSAAKETWGCSRAPVSGQAEPRQTPSCLAPTMSSNS